MSHAMFTTYIKQNLAHRKDIFLLVVRALIAHLNKHDKELSLKVRDFIAQATIKDDTKKTIAEQDYARLVTSRSLKKLVGEYHWEQVLNTVTNVLNS